MRYIEDYESNISNNIAVNNSSIIVTRDTRKLYVDVNGVRYSVSDIVDIPDNTDLEDITPISGKIYYNKTEDKFYINHNGIWNDITSIHPTVKMNKGTQLEESISDNTFTVVDSFKRDEYGHVVEVNTKTYTLPESSHPIVVPQNNTSTEENLNPNDTFTAIDSITKDNNGHIIKYNVKKLTLPSAHIDTSKGEDITREKVINSGNYLTAIDSINLDSYGHIVSITTTKYKMNVSSSGSGGLQSICGLSLLNSIKGSNLQYTIGIDNTNYILAVLDTGDTFYDVSSLNIFGLSTNEDTVYSFRQVGSTAYMITADTATINYTRKIINGTDSGWNRTNLNTDDLFSSF